jgi:hypothetical protein
MDQKAQILLTLQSLVALTPEYERGKAEQTLLCLPSGDGMALVFFDDPTAPLRCARNLARELKKHPEIRLRMGIHSGPVSRLRDINANLGVAGGGINMAQRVMDCGDAGHILLSSTAAEIFDHVTEFSGSLHDIGLAKVKHDIPLHLFSFHDGDVGNNTPPQKLSRQQSASRMRRSVRLVTASTAAALLILAVAFLAHLEERRQTPHTNAAAIGALDIDTGLFETNTQTAAPTTPDAKEVDTIDHPRIANQDEFKITYASRRSNDVLFIDYSAPYLERIKKGGPVVSFTYHRDQSLFLSQPACLYFKAVNNKQQSVAITHGECRVTTSEIDRQPIVVFHSFFLGNTDRLRIDNFGWGRVINPKISFRIDPISTYTTASPLESYTNGITNEISFATFDTSTNLFVAHYIPSQFSNADYVTMIGRLLYSDETVEARQLLFKAMICRGPEPKSAYPRPWQTYDLTLQTGVSNTIKPFSVMEEVMRPGESDQFLLRVHTDKSAQFHAEFFLRTSAKENISAGVVDLHLFQPRFGCEAKLDLKWWTDVPLATLALDDPEHFIKRVAYNPENPTDVSVFMALRLNPKDIFEYYDLGPFVLKAIKGIQKALEHRGSPDFTFYDTEGTEIPIHALNPRDHL